MITNEKGLKIEKVNKKKSKHGKKNWRKNIDISDLEQKNNLISQEKLLKKDVAGLKDEDLFVVDSAPVESLKKNFLNKKSQRGEQEKKKKKLSKNEERLIKRITISEENKNKNLQNKSEEENNTSYDLWGIKTTRSSTKITCPALKFPKVPIPHPGQSYNPSREDLTHLLHRVVDLNKRLENNTDNTILDTEERRQFPPSDDESENEENCNDKDNENDTTEFKVSNNPPVDDFTQRKTLKEKKKGIQKKLNLVKEEELKRRKENRIKLANEKSLKKIEKERDFKLKKEEEDKKLLMQKQKERDELIKMGILEE
jgi:nucleolar protein 53